MVCLKWPIWVLFHTDGTVWLTEMKKQLPETARQSARKEWRRPELKKLPIAATAGSDPPKEVGNEGGGEGKGDSGKTRIS